MAGISGPGLKYGLNVLPTCGMPVVRQGVVVCKREDEHIVNKLGNVPIQKVVQAENILSRKNLTFSLIKSLVGKELGTYLNK